jgi:hypothetical protein
MATGKITKAQLEAEARRVFGAAYVGIVECKALNGRDWVVWIAAGVKLEACASTRMAARRALYELLSSLERKPLTITSVEPIIRKLFTRKLP